MSELDSVATLLDPRAGNWVFSYGSNSISQLRARVQNDNLIAYPGHVVGYDRCFCLSSYNWSGAGCSIFPSPGQVVFGSVVFLSPEEIARLDRFEGGYSKHQVEVSVNSLELTGHCVGSTLPSIAYIADNNYFKVLPSEAYLQAIRIHLLEQYEHNAEAQTIHIRALFPGHPEAVHISTWVPPDVAALSMSALLIAINSKRTTKWVMPQTMRRICDGLEQIGIYSTAQLAMLIARPTAVFKSIRSDVDDSRFNVTSFDAQNLRQRLRASSSTLDVAEFLDDEALALFLKLLNLSTAE